MNISGSRIICAGCGASNDETQRYCGFCGKALNENNLFDAYTEGMDQAPVSDKGYLLISISSIVNLLFFFSVNLISRHSFSTIGTLVFFRIVGLLFSIFLFSVLYYYTRRTNYRAIIAVIGAVCILTNILQFIYRF